MNEITGQYIISKYTKSKMSTRPEFYSGRGAVISDLNSEILEYIYEGVLKEKGKEAAKNFVNLVASIDVLSATGFLNIFYAWVNNGCPEPSDKIATSDIDLPTDDSNKYIAGMATIFSKMSSHGRDDTYMIRAEFCSSHRSEIDKSNTNWMTNKDYTIYNWQ